MSVTGPAITEWTRRRVSSMLLIGVCVTALFGVVSIWGCGPDEKRTRVVLITIDTLRSDAFTGSSDRASSMPLTQAFASTGAVFERFYSATNTTQPSHASILTALHPWQHGLTRNGMALAEDHLTVAERFREAGFETGAVVASFPLERRFGFAQGFDVYADSFDRTYRETWEGQPVEGDGFYALADSVTATAIDLLDRTTASKQFFWFHYFDPHGPFGDAVGPSVEMKEVIRKKFQRAPDATATLARARRLYEADVAALDAALDRLYRRLREDDAIFDTHIVFVSDHGESFGEEGVLGHGSRLNEVQLRVPFFIVSPRIEAGLRTDLAGSIDVTPTLLALAGLEQPAANGRDLIRPPVDGRGSAVGMQQNRVPGGARQGTPDRSAAVYRNRFYTVMNGSIFAGSARGVTNDDSPRKSAPAEVARTLEPLFRDFERQVEAIGAVEAADDETQRGLRALGYLD